MLLIDYLAGGDVFSADPFIRGLQIEASDVNADGVPATVADLVYLIRVVSGAAMPIPGAKLSPFATEARIETQVAVTRRLEPFYFAGRRIHQIALPWHWGYAGLSVGQSANILAPNVGDANTMIPEFKAFLCDVRRV